jgi:hypothetical protein
MPTLSMRNSCLSLISLLVSVTALSPTIAEMSAQVAIEKHKRNDPNTWLFVNGMEQGMDWYNTQLEYVGGKQLYCAPGKLALTVDQILGIVERYLDKHGTIRKDPVGAVLLTALIETFPCNK